MTISISEIVNTSDELAAFPLTGSVAFFISDDIDSVEKRISVVRKIGSNINLSSHIITQLGAYLPSENNNPDYNVSYDSLTKKVTVNLSRLIPLEEYRIVFDTMDSYGVLEESNTTGIGSIEIENYRTSSSYSPAISMTASKDSVWSDLDESFKTEFSYSINSGPSVTVVITHTEGLQVGGLGIRLTNDPFMTGDFFRFSFSPIEDSSINVIEVKATNIENLTQTLDNASKEITELDIIAFYEQMDAPTSVDQPTKINRILKSSSSVLIEFKEPVDINAMTFDFTTGPAFNMLSLPEDDWTAPFRVEAKQLSPLVIRLKIMDSTSAINELVLNV